MKALVLAAVIFIFLTSVAVIDSCLEKTHSNLKYVSLLGMQNIDEIEITTGSIDLYDDIYADIILFSVYGTVETILCQNGISIYTSVVCQCTTVKGKDFWLLVPSQIYSDEIEGRGENYTAGYDSQYFSDPIRVIGSMTIFDKIAENVPSELMGTPILRLSINTHIQYAPKSTETTLSETTEPDYEISSQSGSKQID